MTSKKTQKKEHVLFYPCIICKAKFEYPHQVGEHVEQVHLNEGKNKYICETCGKQVANGCSLKKHMRLHTKETPYFCSYCFKPFSFWTKRKVHEETHKVVTDFHCQECSVYFVDQETLDEHIAAGKCKEASFDCCGKTFENREEFAEHQNTKHKRLELPNQFECKYCGRFFKYFQYKMLHEKRHINNDGTITIQLKTESGRPVLCGNKNDPKRRKSQNNIKCDLCDLRVITG